MNSSKPHEEHCGSVGFCAHARVGFGAVVPKPCWRTTEEPGKTWLMKPQPKPEIASGSDDESSSSVSATTATSESGRRKSARWRSNVASMPS